MTNYCTIEEAWSTPDFGSSNNQNKNQNQNKNKQNTIENTLATKNNNCFNNNFEHMEQFQNFVVERSGEMSSEEEEDSGEEYYNNSYVPFNTQDVVPVKQKQKSNNKNSNNPKPLDNQSNDELKQVVEDLNKKKILLRLDLNVPLKNGSITDETRINKIIPPWANTEITPT